MVAEASCLAEQHVNAVISGQCFDVAGEVYRVAMTV